MKASFLSRIPISFFYIAAILLLPSRNYGQQHYLKTYNVNDGLPNTITHEMYQDKYGYLWIGTPSGISRFDGRQFVNYSIADGLPSLNVLKIFQDSKERLWVGTAAGMTQFKNDRFITYPTSDSLNNIWVFNFVETKDKLLWALTSKGIYEFADSVWKKIALYPGFKNRACRNIIEINDELFICYSTDIMCRNKGGKWLHIASQDTYGSIFNVMSLQHKQIWISTISNIYEIHDYKLVPLYKRNISYEHYFSYLFDSKNRLWLAGDDFLKISKPGDWHHFSGSINQSSHCFFVNEDSSHNVWVGTMEGLVKIKDIDFTIVDKDNKAPLDGIYNIIPLPNNNLLFSSGKKTGLLLYDNNSCKQIMPPKAPGNENYYRDPVDAYTFDDQNTLWMVTRFKKFLHFNGKALEDFSGALHLKTTENIYDMIYAKKRKEFFVCADSTLLYGKHSNFLTFIPHNTGIPIVKPTRIRELENGLMLLYIDGIGVYAINKSNNLINLIKETHIDGSKKGVQLGVIFYESSDNSFWIAIPGLGLYEYGFAKNQLPFLKNHITIKDGLQSNQILSLTNDLKNRLWVATNSGIDILQKNKAGSWDVFNYASAEDLTIDIIGYFKFVSDKEGNVWLASPKKIIKFNPSIIKLYKETPHIIIENISIDFKETDWSKLNDSLYSYYQLPYNQVLNYNQNSLGIFFNAIDLSVSNSNPEYSYKLLPLDTSWSIPSKTKSVSLAQLPSGKYQFVVRAKDKASGWSRPATFQFTIRPPFWDKWWFRLIIIAIAAFIIINIFNVREKKIIKDAYIENQLKELEMKALKAQMNPHFIYNALNSIQALVANDKKTEGIRYLGSFSRLLRQVLDNSENNVISLDKELETISLYIQLESLRLDMQLKYKKSIPQNIVAEFEKVPPLILQPFVENSLWHGLSHKEGEKEIIITVSSSEEWLLCEISDNGIGREKAQEWKNNSAAIHKSKGIDITVKRLIDFNGDDQVIPVEFFDLYDDKKKVAGTLVIVRIKRKFNSLFV
jgi:ligand-binding sensor domain-containing protein